MFALVAYFAVVFGVIYWARQEYKRRKAKAEVRARARDNPPELLENPSRLSGIRDRAAGQSTAALRAAATDNAPATPIRADPSVTKHADGRVEESVTVVLRKQIPPRDEPARSWLGGLPMMPPSVEWPRGVNPEHPGDGEVPLHFIAQIACADLPAELWGGLGPRDGWLLLFVNGNTSDNSDPGTWRLLHQVELGEERQPPTELGPIHDGVYTGQTSWTRSQRLFPRWPVDLLVMSNQLRIVEGRSLAAPDNLAQQLYPGQPINDNRWAIPKLVPFDRATVAIGLRAAAKELARPIAKINPDVYDWYCEPGNADRLEAKWSAMERKARDTNDERLASYVAECRKVDGEVRAAASTSDALRAFIADENEAYTAWAGQTVSAITAWLDELAASDQSAMIDEPERRAMEERVAAATFTQHAIFRNDGYEGLPDAMEFKQRTTSVADLARDAWIEGVRDNFPAVYLDPVRRAALPADTVAGFEAFWRALKENRPHRMGGYHDGLQSDAQPGPVGQLLVMQLAADEGMQWRWGDNGAVYCFMTPADLEAGAWDRADFQLECH